MDITKQTFDFFDKEFKSTTSFSPISKNDPLRRDVQRKVIQDIEDELNRRHEEDIPKQKFFQGLMLGLVVTLVVSAVFIHLVILPAVGL